MIEYTNIAGLPKVIANWLAEDKYDGYTPDPNTFSATTIIGSHKKAFLNGYVRAAEDIVVEIDVLKRSASKRGTAVHDSIELYIKEHQPDGVRAEERHKRQIEVDGTIYTVSAKFDAIEDEVMHDWKNTSVYAHNDLKKMEDWKLQLSICRWACEPQIGVLKEHGTIVAFFSQFSQEIANKDAPFSYPTYAIQPYHFDLLSYEETEDYLRQRIRERVQIKSLEDANAITCTPEDLWTVGAAYKYFSNPDNKRATKTSSNLAELQKLKREKGGVIIEPMPKACAYCEGRESCEQYQGFVQRGLLNATKSF